MKLITITHQPTPDIELKIVEYYTTISPMQRLVRPQSTIQIYIKYPAVWHYSNGSKLSNCLSTRLRNIRSDLKCTIGQVDNPEYFCHAKDESHKHSQSQTLFALVGHFQNFQKIQNII